jgi:hypothetical protein
MMVRRRRIKAFGDVFRNFNLEIYSKLIAEHSPGLNPK